MKNIVIVNEELDKATIPANLPLVYKKNKTIFKEVNKDVSDYVKTLDPKIYKYYIEEWEFASSTGFQIAISPAGYKMRPVHVVTKDPPPYGFKALFQTESLIVFSFEDKKFILKRAKIDTASGWRNVQIIAKGECNDIMQLTERLPVQVKSIVQEAWQKWQEVLEKKTYAEPLFADVETNR